VSATKTGGSFEFLLETHSGASLHCSGEYASTMSMSEVPKHYIALAIAIAAVAGNANRPSSRPQLAAVDSY
jgi:hypothetical protein